MKNKQLNRNDAFRLCAHIQMEDWHFNTTIRTKCIEISTEFIGISHETGETRMIFATVYGLEATKIKTGDRCIANFFIRCGSRVYQEYSIQGIANLLELLRRELAIQTPAKEKVEEN